MQRMDATGGDFWISLSDFGEEGKFVWEHSQVEAVDFTAWGAGQPDGDENINCVAMMEEHYYFWTDEDCNSRKKPACYAPVYLNPCGYDGAYIPEFDR